MWDIQHFKWWRYKILVYKTQKRRTQKIKKVIENESMETKKQ